MSPGLLITAKEAGIRAAERKLDEAKARAANPEPYIPLKLVTIAELTGAKE